MPQIPLVGRNRPRTRLLLFGIAAFLWLGVLLHLFPVAWMISASFKPTREIFERPFDLIPEKPTSGPYQLLLKSVVPQYGSVGLDTTVFRYPLWTYLQNSLIIAFFTVLLQI